MQRTFGSLIAKIKHPSSHHVAKIKHPSSHQHGCLWPLTVGAQPRPIDFACDSAPRLSSDIQTVFLFFASQSHHKYKKKIRRSKIQRNFPPFFLLHKLHKPMPSPCPLSPTTHPPIPAEHFKLICRRRISLKCVKHPRPIHDCDAVGGALD